MLQTKGIHFWSIPVVRSRLLTSNLKNNNLLFAKRSNFFLAPKVGTPISRKSCSVKVAKVCKSTSCLTNKSVYFANPCFEKRVGKSSVGKMALEVFGLEGWNSVSRALLEFPNQPAAACSPWQALVSSLMPCKLPPAATLTCK